MKIRRVYKRDKDGQFARVNTLINGIGLKRKVKSKANSPKALPSKSRSRDERRRDTIEPQILDAAAGRLSLAEGPAREIAKKHDLSGANRSEANKAAYRECAKYARELKAKYGADAPTADRIYSAAKLIQRGGDIGAKIRQEEGGEGPAPKPQPPKQSPKPGGGLRFKDDGELRRRKDVIKDRIKIGAAKQSEIDELNDIEEELKRRRESRKVSAGTKIAGTELKRGDVFQIPGGSGEYVVVNNDGKTIVAEKLRQNKLTQVRFEASRMFEKTGEGKEPRVSYGSGPGAPRPEKPKPNPKPLKAVPIDQLEGLNTADLIDQYNLADQSGRTRVRDAAMNWLKSRANTGDEEAANFLRKDPNGPKLPELSLVDINKRIGRAVRMLRGATTEEKKIYQDRIDNYNKMFEERLSKGSLADLKKDLTEAQRELTNARREAKVYRARAKRSDNPNGSFMKMAETAEREVQVSLGTVNKIKSRIEELKGKKSEDPVSNGSDLLFTMDRNDTNSPPKVRLAREDSVIRTFDNWFSSYTYDLSKQFGAGRLNDWRKELVDSDGGYTDWKRILRDNDRFREDTIAKYNELIKDPSPLNNPENAYIYRDMTERGGYNDISDKERIALAESDIELLEDWLNPETHDERLELGFLDWLENSDSANDLSENYGYDTQSLFEIYADSDAMRNVIRSEYIDMERSLKKLKDKLRAEKFDASEVAKSPRPPKPQDPKDIEPVEYQAKSNSVAELRRELASREQSLAYGVTKVFGDASFAKLTPEQQDAERDKYRQKLDEISNLREKILKIKPDRSVSLDRARNLDEAFEIFSNRNPGIRSLSGWHEPDGELVKQMEAGGVYSEAHKKIVLKRVLRFFDAAERMHDEFPDVPFDGLNAKPNSAFSTPNAIAHCSRGKWIHVEINARYLINDSPSPNKNSDGFHPPGFEKDPFYNVMVHEFGHSIDWMAFGLHDIANDNSLLDRNEGKGVARDKIWKRAVDEIFDERDMGLKNVLTDLYLKMKDDGLIPESMSFDAFYRKNTSGYARTNYHELIAESWQDYHTNGTLLASPISVAITEFVLQTYRDRMREGKAAPYVIKTAN